MAKYLPEFGVEPIIITVDEKYASYPVKDHSFLQEVPSELKVIRTKSFEPLQYYSKIVGKKNVPYSGFANVETDSFLSKISRWVRGNFFIPDARKGWNEYALRAAREIIAKEGIDIVVTTGPPHSTHLIGLNLKQEIDLIWIADFRDPWTDIYYYDQLLHSARSIEKDKRMELSVLVNSDLIFAVCPSNKLTLSNKIPHRDRSKLRLLPNGFDEADFDYTMPSVNSTFTLVYTGTLASSYNFRPLFAALGKLSFDWKLVIAGSIAPEIKVLLRESDFFEKVEYRGYLSHEEVLGLLVSADMLLHVLPKNEKGTSGKLFEYLGAGKPILNLAAKDGDSAYYIQEANAGVTFNGEEVTNMVDFIESVRRGEVSFNPSRELYTRRARAEKLAETIHTLSKFPR